MHTLNLLKALWAHSKALALAVGAFVVGQLFFAYKQIDSMPFYNYGMYSGKAQLYKEYNTFFVEADGQPLDLRSMPCLARDFLLNNLYFYAELRRHGDKVEATIRETVARRFSFLSEGARNYCIEQLSNSPVADEIAMRAWLARFLGRHRPHTKNINVYEVRLTPQGTGFAALDTFKLL